MMGIITSELANKKEFLMTEEEFLDAADKVKTQFEAENLLHKIYALSSESWASSFKANIEVTWKVFYRILNLEKEFNILNHFAAAYALMNVCSPALNNLWFTKTRVPEQRWCGQEDFMNSCFLYVSDLLEVSVDEKGKEHGYNPERNDNILPWAMSTFTSCVNSVLAPDISRYLQKTYGYSSMSLDEPCDSEDHQIQVADLTQCVEDYVIAKIESETTGKAVSQILSENTTDSKKIEDLMTLKKLGLTDAEIEKIVGESAEEEAEAEKEAI